MRLTVSAEKTHIEQGKLWEWVGNRDLNSVAQSRPYVGDFYEEAARVLFGAVRHQIDSRKDYCPDLSVGPNRYLESKAVGCSGQGIVFRDRINKDSRLVREGATLTYLFWRHSVKVEAYASLHELRAALADNTHTVLAVPFERLRAATRTLKLLCLLTSERGNRMGYRLPWKLLESLATDHTLLDFPVVKVHGQKLHGVTLYGSNLGRCFPALNAAEQDAAGLLHFELCESYLQVELSPAPSPKYNGHMVREAWNTNPKWYQQLCRKHTKKRSPAKARNRRHHDTDIRRPSVMRALERLTNGQPPCYVNDFYLLPIIRAAAAVTA